jgi:serine O-acetyltransferase
MGRNTKRVELTAIDGVWQQLRLEAESAAAEEPTLASLLHCAILSQGTIADALANRLARRLGGADLDPLMIREVCVEAFADDPEILDAFDRDMRAVRERDPACTSYLQPFLYFKGFAALQAYRVAHWLWHKNRHALAFHLQSLVSEMFQVDIHPAAVLGKGLFLDHATGVVIGETCVVGDDVSILQNVTLGGTGKERGDRHPKIGKGVLISVGAKILGNIRVGDNARIAAGSVVLHEVPAGATVAGVPAKVIRGPIVAEPAMTMDHFLAEGI